MFLTLKLLLQVACDRKSQITQHVATDLHKKKTHQLSQTKMAQQSFKQAIQPETTKNEQQIFNAGLCKAFLAANISFQKLQNPELKKFLELYCGRTVPDESTLRKGYVNEEYIKIIRSIKEVVKNHYVYLIVDETTDCCGRYIANLLIGVLSSSFGGKSYLIACKQLDKTNHLTILRFVNEALMNFFRPEIVPTEKILLLLSDAATYMVKAGQQLKMLYPNLIHVTCLAHGLNRVAEEIRNQFPDVNALIGNVKKIFLKSPLRIQLYKEKLPNVNLPPEPVITRWGTWLNAATFYALHFTSIKELIMDLEEVNNQAIKKCQALFKKETLGAELAFIQSNYEFVSRIILNLETQGMPLNESVGLIEEFQTGVKKVNGKVGQIINKKFYEVLEKNHGYILLSKTAKIIGGYLSDQINIEPNLISKFKYAPITSVDVERSFSRYKQILSDRRRNFLVENIEKYIIVNYNITAGI